MKIKASPITRYAIESVVIYLIIGGKNMGKIKGKLTLLINADHTDIEIFDEISGLKILTLEVSAMNFQLALSRLSRVSCDIFANDPAFDKLGKKQTNKYLEFEMPKDVDYKDREKVAREVSKKRCPDGWVCDEFFGGQGSFRFEGDKLIGKCMIRKWEE